VSLRVIVRRKAKADIREACKWYENQRAGLGRSFVAEVNAAIARILTMATVFPEVVPGVRRALTARFPYAIYFRVEQARIIVIVVVLSSRDSAIWQQRVDDELRGS
jgi:plasmid stabilization system protein ParE